MRLQAHAASRLKIALLCCLISLFNAGDTYPHPLPKGKGVGPRILYSVSTQGTVGTPSAGLGAPLKIGLSHAVGGAASVAVMSECALVISGGDRGQVIERGTEGAVYRIDAESNGLEISSLEGSDQRVLGVFPYALTLTCAAARGTTSTPTGDQAAASPGSAPDGGNAAQSRGIKIAAVGPGGLNNSVWHRYRGSITVRRLPDGLVSAVNTVGLEEYLYGVLAPEMGGSAPVEALKAQAIASRTYALKNRGRFAADGFDLDDTTRCQQYEGMDGETSLVTAAVDATKGMVLCYQDALIDAYFSTDCGGVTAVDTTGQRPYLQAVVDSPGQGQPDYAMASPYRTWDCRFSQSQLLALLNKDVRTRVANFVSLSLDSLDASGRIETATVADANGTLKTVTGAELREILGYDTLRSTRVTLTVKSNGDYVFHGMGWGHGFGMSQMGAAAMAAAPYNKSYTDILTHYYVGVKIENLADQLHRVSIDDR